MRVVFMGTPDFAVPTLKALIKEHEVQAVITQPDRAKGRGKKMQPSPVKIVALEHDLPCWQPQSLKDDDVLKELKVLQPEVCVVVAFGQILPREILHLPRYGCINVHASLLPKYRGSAPIHRAVINGEKITGVTTMQMDVGLDTGDILFCAQTEIGKETTVGELHDVLAQMSPKLLLETLTKIEAKTIEPKPQEDAASSYAPPITKEDERIDWNKKTLEIFNLVRGLNPWPGAYTEFKGKRLKIWRVKPHSLEGKPGEILEIFPDSFAVATANGSVLINELQPAGKKRMPAEAFLRGNQFQIGDTLA